MTQQDRVFRGLHYRLLPRWLWGGDGEKVLYSLGVLIDAAVERVRLGLLARFPQHALSDALPFLGKDRKIRRGRNESDEAYAARLLLWLDDHQVKGTPLALMRQLRAYLNADVMIRTIDVSGNWCELAADGTFSFDMGGAPDWDWGDGVPSSQWSRFWIVIYPTAGEPWSIQGQWSAPGLYGGSFGASDQCIGFTATAEEIASIRALIREWQPDGTRCEWVIVAFDPASFDPAAPEPDGTYNWARWGRDSGGNIVPTRLSTARYFAGVDGRLA